MLSSSSSSSSRLFTKGCTSLAWLPPVRRIRPFSVSEAKKPIRLVSLGSFTAKSTSLLLVAPVEDFLIHKRIQHHPLAPTLCNRRLLTSSSSSVSQNDEEESISTDTNNTQLFKFQHMVDLHPASKVALEKMGLERATEIQTKTWPIALKGQDILGRARTGTGKTLAFLLPSLERIVQEKSNDSLSKIRMLVLSPTRELALQIANETRTLVTAHNQYNSTESAVSGTTTSLWLTHQVMVGGSSRIQDVQKLEQRLPDILVATPGRLADHLQNTSIGEHSFASLLHDINILVLDETDRLLDSGFRPEVETILSHLSTDKQTLLFSATLPPEVRSILQQNLKSNFETIDCIHESNTATHVHPKVSQSFVVLPNMDTLVQDTIQLLMNLISSPKNKIIVFFPTTHLTRFYAQIFNFGLGVSVLELHSKKSQSFRISASNRFRELDRGALFTSDVSARGVDYPNVTHVVQVGMAETRQAYIHRLGRTARGSTKKGEGILILNPLEQGFLFKELKGFDILPNEEMKKVLTEEESSDDDEINGLLHVDLEPIWNSIRNGDNATLRSSAQDAYRSMLGFYLGRLPQVGIVKQHKQKLVQLVNSFSQEVGMVEPPYIRPKTAQNMGLANVPGIRIGHYNDTSSSKHSSHNRQKQKRRRSLARVQQQWGRVDERLYDDWGRSVDTSKSFQSPDIGKKQK